MRKKKKRRTDRRRKERLRRSRKRLFVPVRNSRETQTTDKEILLASKRRRPDVKVRNETSTTRSKGRKPEAAETKAAEIEDGDYLTQSLPVEGDLTTSTSVRGW